jgi:hypothetical protein
MRWLPGSAAREEPARFWAVGRGQVGSILGAEEEAGRIQRYRESGANRGRRSGVEGGLGDRSHGHHILHTSSLLPAR